MADTFKTNNGKTCSRTVTDTITGEHTHTIVGYSLVKGIGDGEPIASERFSVGGHEWVLLFYPDGKRSSSSEGHLGGGPVGDHGGLPLGAPVLPPPVVPGGQGLLLGVPHAGPQGVGDQGDGHPPGGAPNPVNLNQNHAIVMPPPHNHHHGVGPNPLGQVPRQPRRDTTNEYAALFVALIGEGPNPQGVVNTSEGKVVRAFHRFTLVDQTGQGRDLTKGRTRDAGAVKISCARQDPNARNCHGYRKFVKRSILEDPNRGFLVDDTLVIKYTIELVVSTGGALSRGGGSMQCRADLIRVPPSSLGHDLEGLLISGKDSDYTIVVEDEENKVSEDFKVHRIILEARSPYFNALLNAHMKEGAEGRAVIKTIQPAVFKALLHFVYVDCLPEDLEGPNLDVPMAQHLLVAADQYQLNRLRRICEKRLCESVDVETAATTLTLAEQSHAEELKRVCLEFVSKNLAAVLATDGYRHMTRSCPVLQAELLNTLASVGPGPSERHGHAHRGQHVRMREHNTDPEQERRVRARRNE